jgi:hypothetical protein
MLREVWIVEEACREYEFLSRKRKKIMDEKSSILQEYEQINEKNQWITVYQVSRASRNLLMYFTSWAIWIAKLHNVISYNFHPSSNFFH